ncbi:MAG: hypothetical protein L6Q99_18925 [Planctomycetes bacterium]|nr:hypothetical protein [Planctomycetota bacterium]
MARFVKFTILGSSLALAATSCGGGGSSSDGGTSLIEGLSAPSELSVVTATGGSAMPSGGAAHVAPGYNAPPGSDYELDAAKGHVYDPSMQSIDTVNGILCMVSQTAYDAMVNEGQYVAQVNEDKCGMGNDGGSGDEGQSSSQGLANYTFWVVDSTRADNSSPQQVQFWLESEMGPSTDGVIQAQVDIDSGPSDVDPFGSFELNFAGIADGETIADPTMWGTLGTVAVTQGHIGFQFYQDQGDVDVVHGSGEFSERVAVTVDMAGDQTSGIARVSRIERFGDPMNGDTGQVSGEYTLAFDQDYVLRGKDSDTPVCLYRDQFLTHIWRYNLYHASGLQDGERVTLNSGFPIKTVNDEHGYIGYWGLWAPPDVTIANGDTVYKDEWGTTNTTPYTVIKSPGKLIRHTKNVLDLADADGLLAEWWDFSQQPAVRYQVELQDPDWVAIAAWDDNAQAFVDLGSPLVIDTSAIGFLNMWSNSLGGQVSYVHGNTYLTFFAQEFVTGDDPALVGGALALYGYTQCLDSAITATEAENGDVFLADSFDINTPYVFQFDGSDMTLYHDVNGDGSLLTQVGLADGEVPASGPFTWGMQSGAMVEDTGTLVNPWDAWNADVFYTYETGANDWNQYTALWDPQLAAYVDFDPPIQFSYTHSTVNDKNADSTYDGQTFMLSYGGPGNLWGIPSTGIDLTGDNEPDRWVPQFSLADGVVMGPNGTEYAVRGIEMEMTLLEDPAGCAGLDLLGAAALVLPDGTTYTAPNIGPMPDLDDAPAVIEGVVQGL